MMSLDQVLDRLLHDSAYRGALLRGEVAELGLRPEDRDAVVAIDLVELERTARNVRDDLLNRKHRGTGGLRELFPGTLEAWRVARPADNELAELLDAFMCSLPFRQHREIPYAGEGLSLEEAFFRFAEIHDIGDAALREQEFLNAMVRALAVSPRATFSIPRELKACPGGYFAIASRGSPMLYAATRGKLVCGPITAFLAALLANEDDARTVARRHGVDSATLEAALHELALLDLI